MVKLNFNAIKSLLKKNTKKRPILNCINYKDSSILFTDSFSLVEISTQNNTTFLLNVETLKIQGGTYPNTDNIKPSEIDLKDVEHVELSTKLDVSNKKVETYIINEYPFDRKLVDNTFKTISKDFLRGVTKNELKIKEYQQYGTLVYQKDEVYILILGLAKELDNEW